MIRGTNSVGNFGYSYGMGNKRQVNDNKCEQPTTVSRTRATKEDWLRAAKKSGLSEVEANYFANVMRGRK